MKLQRAVVILLVASGCSNLCTGPGCEADYETTRLVAWAAPDPLVNTEDEAWDSPMVTVDGDVETGIDWVVRPGRDGAIWIGQPDRSRVIRAEVSGQQLVELARFARPLGDEAGTDFLVADLDGDNVTDLLMSAPGAELGRGQLLFYRGAGNAQGDPTPDVEWTGHTPSDGLGRGVALCGDWTGDGLPEVAAWTPWFVELPDGSLTAPSLGGAVTLLRSELLVDSEGGSPYDLGPTWVADQEGAGLGTAMDCATDHTGDGVPELFLGAPWADDTTGRVYVVSSEPTETDSGPAPLPDSGPIGERSTWFGGDTDEQWFGRSVLSFTLVDGAIALAVGSPGFDGGQGRISLYEPFVNGQFDSPAPRTLIRAGSGGTADHVGRWLTVGFFDDDTVPDLVIGVPDKRGTGQAYDAGQALVFRGAAATGWPLQFSVDSADWTLNGTTSFARVGRAPAAIDLDGDGIDELWLPTHRQPDE